MLDEIDKLIIGALGEELPLEAEPYAAIAARIGLDPDDFLNRLEKLRKLGVLRRLGLVLRHRELGYGANALCVWQVDPDGLDAAGELFAQRPEISHCYSRKPLPAWPYNLYAMLHAHSRDTCLNVAAELAEQVGCVNYQVLFSTKEWKKTTMRYDCGRRKNDHKF